jgi:hypothetical protein
MGNPLIRQSGCELLEKSDHIVYSYKMVSRNKKTKGIKRFLIVTPITWYDKTISIWGGK